MLFTKKMTPVVAEEFSETTLEVEVCLDSGELQWMRQGVLIHPGAKYTLKHNGQKHSLTIHKLTMSDRGTYSCETLHDRTQTQLTVERECACALTMACCCLFTVITDYSTSSLPPALLHPLLLVRQCSLNWVRVIWVTGDQCSTSTVTRWKATAERLTYILGFELGFCIDTG